MEITAEDVDRVEAVRQTVMQLIDVAEDNPEGPLDKQNLKLLEVQLDSLHQALSMVVAQKEAMQSEMGDEDA